MDVSIDTVEQVRTTLVDLALKFGPRVLAATLILTIGFFVGRAVAGWLHKGLLHMEMEVPVRLLLVRMARLAVMALFVIMALQNLGIELLPLIAGLGIAGAGIALAMQGVLSNLFAGLSIIFSKPFKLGEYIGIAGEEGRVGSITLFQTTLSHLDRSLVVIPNRKIAGEILHNYGKVRQLDVHVRVAYDTDLNEALAVVDEVLRTSPRVLRDIEPLIGTALLGDSSVKIAIKPWVSVTDFAVAAGEINKAVLEAFRARDIVIPVPQHEVRLLNEAA
jgi:small conductance mechanosensitive channel